MAIAVYYGKKTYGDLEGESSSCLEYLNFVCIPGYFGRGGMVMAGGEN